MLVKIPNITSNSSIAIMNKCSTIYNLFQLEEEALKEILKNSKVAKSAFEFFNKSTSNSLDDDLDDEKVISKKKLKK